MGAGQRAEVDVGDDDQAGAVHGAGELGHKELDAVELWRTGAVRSVVHAVYALDDVTKAHEEIEARANVGRIVLIP